MALRLPNGRAFGGIGDIAAIAASGGGHDASSLMFAKG